MIFSYEQKLRHIHAAGLSESNLKFPKIGSGSLEDLRSAIRDAVKNIFPSSYPIIVSTFEGHVIVEIEEQNTTVYYQIPYEIGKGGVELGAPFKVLKKVSYQKEARRQRQEARRQRLAGITEEAPVKSQGSLTKAQQRDQFLAGIDTRSRQGTLSENRGTRRELKEVLTQEQVRILEEAKIEGLASRGEVINNNGRRYSLKVLQKQPSALKEKIQKGQFLAFLDHGPDGQALLKDATAKITSLEMQGNDLKYEAEILNTPGGKILNSLLKAGVTVENSIKGYGSTKKVQIDGRQIEDVLDDYELSSIDFVSDASTKGAEVTRLK